MEAVMIQRGEVQSMSDEQVIACILQGDVALFEIVLRRYNQRLYRLARAITGDAGEAENVVRDACVCAYRGLKQFAGRTTFATWLTRITISEALERLRREGRLVEFEETTPTVSSDALGPEQHVANRELGELLEEAVDALPDIYRAAFMLRDVEGLSTSETAACLDITEQTAKKRLHRARVLLRNHLSARAQTAVPATFQFAGARRDALVTTVLARIARLKQNGEKGAQDEQPKTERVRPLSGSGDRNR
jgi:RNA polymerase sigma-70 factor (ECF subfamily)